MITLFHSVVIVNAFFFLIYGIQCFASPRMVLEFNRFGLSNPQRVMTGSLQILGAVGLLTGFIFPIIGLLASGGLALMMLVAFMVRIKIKDGFLESAPSLIFLAMNAWIFSAFYSLL